MTDLDDALDRPNPLFKPVEITAEWEELPPAYSPGTVAVDDLRDLGQQIGPGGYTVKHSFDDGLPDTVTMTGSNDASGQFECELVGRQQVMANAAGQKTAMTGGSGTGTSITITPNNTSNNDHSLVAVAISSSVTWTSNIDPLDRHRWKLLSSVVDGSVQLLVFGRRHYTGAPSLVLTLSASSAWVWTGVSTNAETFPNVRAYVPIKFGTPSTLAESVNQTTHTLPMTTLDKRGWFISFWAAGSSIGWTPGGDHTELTESAGSPRLMMQVSPLRFQQWSETITAVTASATDVVAAIGIPVQIADRPEMDALQYFSPFNQDSPIWDFERDTAPVTVAQPVVSPNGPYSTQIFDGQMADIGIKGRLASMSALSKTRVDLDRTLFLPTIRGDREGCTVDWLATWIMSRANQYVGPGPSAYTRWWIPFYGSGHSFFGGPNDYAKGQIYDISNPGVPYKWESPSDVVGPFVTGMFASYQNDRVYQLCADYDRVEHPEGATEFGFDPILPHSNDLLSQANNRGRISFWVRGDATSGTSAAVAGAPPYTNTLFRWRLVSVRNGDSAVFGEVSFVITEARTLQVFMGSALDGYSNSIMGSSAIPTDGNWHYIALTWDWDAASFQVRRNSTTWTINNFTTTTDSNLPTTEAANNAAGGSIFQTVRSALPIADFQVEAGDVPYNEGTAGRFFPSVSGVNAVYYPTRQWIQAVADETPVQGWPTLAELAQATLASYRTDEEDQFNFLDLAYFGQADQMTPTIVADTQVNASELNVISDPSKTRNVVTMEFDETRVDTNLSRVMQLTSSIAIPRGTTTIIFTLDEQVAEIYGSVNPFYSNMWDIYKMSATQITNGAVPTALHSMTLNTSSEGTGTVYTGSTVRARVQQWNSTSVTVKFINGYTRTLYLANNGSDVPFLTILGYALRVNKAYATESDNGSITSRRQRALTASSRWIQRRYDASAVAGKLVNMLARPRPEVTVEVMGDPRRRPGMMIELADAEGTRAEGTWRILSITHVGNGAQYTQQLQLVRVYPVAVWDGSDGWDNSVWAE